MKPIPFFTCDIAIKVDECSKLDHLGKTITVGEFAAGDGVALYELDDGRLLLRKAWDIYNFIKGEWA